MSEDRMEIAQAEQYESDLAAAKARIAELEGQLSRSLDEAGDRIMAMNDDQIKALTRLEGRDPDDVAKLARKSLELAEANRYIEELKLTLPCGHHASLLVESVESDYKYCDLCECRKMRNDADSMERYLRAKLSAAEQERDEAHLAAVMAVEDAVKVCEEHARKNDYGAGGAMAWRAAIRALSEKEKARPQK